MVSLRHGVMYDDANDRVRWARDGEANFDQYAELDHKRGMDPDKGEPFETQTWLPDDHNRRIIAYRILHQYLSNTARHVGNFDFEEDRQDHREWGEPAALRDRIVAGLINDLEFKVDGLALAEAPPPSLDEEPAEPSADASDLERRRYELAHQAWEDNLNEELDMYEEARRELPRLRRWQNWIDEWVLKDDLIGKIEQAETEHAVPLGDAVFVVENRGDRPSVTVYEPDSFIADYQTGKDFPDRVDLVWELPIDDDNPTERRQKIRRVTFEMIPNPEFGPDGEQLTSIGVRYRYQKDASELQCVKTDVVFDKQNMIDHYSTKALSGRKFITDVREWDTDRGDVQLLDDGTPLNQFPLSFDFIPVVHVPNRRTSTGYGRSSFMGLIQLFDDIAGFDGDLVDAMDMAAKPMVVVSGTQVPPDLEIEPGTIIGIGQAAEATALDTTAAAKVCLDVQETTLDRLATNSHVGRGNMGKSDSSVQLSGVAIKRMTRPYADMLASLQRPRRSKYALIIKMAMRIALQAGQIEEQPKGDQDGKYGLPPGIIAHFGPYDIDDVSTTAQDVANLKTAGMSRITIARAAKAGGIDVGDPHDEAERSRREDGVHAEKVFKATGSDVLAADALGLQLPDDEAPAPSGLPPVPGVPPVPTVSAFNTPQLDGGQ